MASSLNKKNVLLKRKHTSSATTDTDVVATVAMESESFIEASEVCQLGSLVKVLATPHQSECRRGILRFMGTTDFANGPWAGIELVGSPGRNNGSVKGRKYFDCSPGQGIFVRPNLVALYVETKQEEDGDKVVPLLGGTEGLCSNKLPLLTEGLNQSGGANTTGPKALKGEDEFDAGDSIGALRRIFNLESEAQPLSAAWGTDIRPALKQPDTCTALPSSSSGLTEPPRGKDAEALWYGGVPTIEEAFTVEEDGAPLLLSLKNGAGRNWQPKDVNKLPSQGPDIGENRDIEYIEVDSVRKQSSDSSNVLFEEKSHTPQVMPDDSQKVSTSSRSELVAHTLAVVSELEKCKITVSNANEQTVESAGVGEGVVAGLLVKEKDAKQKHFEPLKVGVSSLRENLCIQCRASAKMQEMCGAIALRIEILEKALKRTQDGATNITHESPCETYDIISALKHERDELKEICDLQESELIKEREQSDELSKVLNTVSDAHTRAVAEWAKVRNALETQLQHITQRLEEAELWKQRESARSASLTFDAATYNSMPEDLQIQKEGLNHRVQELSRQLDASGLLVLQLRKEKEATEVLHKRGEVLRCELEEALETQKQREREAIQNYEDTIQQLRNIKDKAHAECIYLHQQLKDVRAKGQNNIMDSIENNYSITTLSNWERDKYETIIRQWQRAFWGLRRRRFFSALPLSIKLVSDARSKDMLTRNLFAMANKVSSINMLSCEARKEVDYVNQSVYFSLPLVSKLTWNPDTAIPMPEVCILDFSTEQARKQSTRRMFRYCS